MSRSNTGASGESPQDEPRLRVDLAAAFRMVADFGWHESVGNHFSAAVSCDGRHFLLNPRWKHFSLVRASDLILLDATDDTVMDKPGAPDPSAWAIHGAIHRIVPNARVIIHCHPPHATALACLKDPSLKPIDQNTARFFGMIGIDTDFGGIADDAAEGARLAGLLGNMPIFLMGNHGVTVTAPTVAQAFEHLYFLERAAQTLMLAYASGQPLNVLTEEMAARTAHDWLSYEGMAFAHFEQLKTLLDKKDASYRD